MNEQTDKDNSPVCGNPDFELATQEYASIVEMCASNDLSIELSNRHIEHAAILTNAILGKTREHASILTGDCPELFFDKIKAALIAALDRGAEIRVILVNGVQKASALIELAKERASLKVFRVQETAVESVKAVVPHFCVSDSMRYRLEQIHEDKDFAADRSVSAVANFNQPNIARTLQTTFEKVLSLTVPCAAS